ncbi:g4003 [Coccomyxa elongata]
MTEALVAYASSGDDANEKGDTSEDSYFVGSDDESVDSATARRMEAERRLRDADEISTGPAKDLPDPLSALGQIRHAPSYLTPEATRPLAAPAHRSRLAQTAPARAENLERDKNASPSTWDIARMAPPLKGQTDASKRGLPAGAVLSAAAKRYKPEDDAAGGITTAAQIAMLGGQWRPSADEDSEPAAIGPVLPGGLRDGMQGKKGPTKAMAVSEFMDKGIGGAALPRRKQDRKDKEKSKRALGQSAIGSWKTEAEMVLRQQYDS